MIVYHGSTVIVTAPDVRHSFRALDFGRGFYATSNREQAESWARRRANVFGGRPIINRYEMSDDFSGLQVKTFPEDLMAWIDFVCDCRDGKNVYSGYDIIMGRVADDKVFRVVDLYHAGIWDRERALREIRVYPNYDQIAFITQAAIDRLLKFDAHWEVLP